MLLFCKPSRQSRNRRFSIWVEDGSQKTHEIYPFDEDTAVDQVNAHSWPDPGVIDYSGIKAACEKYRDDYALYGSPWCPFFHEIGWLVGQENFLVWMHTKPEVVQTIIDRIVDYQIEVVRRFLEEAKGLVDIAYFGNDFGTQLTLFVSPDMWQQFIRKPLKRFYDLSHDYGCKVMQHSCGAIRDIIPFLIEDGLDILDPIQVAAENMDFEGLYKDFGDQVCLHGGVDTQGVLPFGTEDEVRNQVRHYLEVAGNKGGYILTGSQDLIEDIPSDNVFAMYDENCKMVRA